MANLTLPANLAFLTAEGLLLLVSFLDALLSLFPLLLSFFQEEFSLAALGAFSSHH